MQPVNTEIGKLHRADAGISAAVHIKGRPRIFGCIGLWGSIHKKISLLQKLLTRYQGQKLGIFCSNDDIASLVLRECIKKRIPVPDSMELIGYDNSPVSDFAVYPITSVDQNIPLMAQIAVESLENYRCYESIVPARMVKKDTTSSGG